MYLEDEARRVLLSIQQTHPRTRDEVRGVLLQRKRENLIRHWAKLRRVQGAAIRVIGRVEYDRIRPKMIYCAPQDKPLWDYLRHCVSSAPWQDRPGRALRLFCVDEYSRGVLGIVDMGSDLQTLGPRDRHIGWTHGRKMKGGGLRHVANLGTCVCVTPFGWLTGGKCMSVMMAAREFGDVWHHRYGDRLGAVTTTSFYGKSSQYNRLKEYRYLGDTGGGGVAHLDDGSYRLLKAFVVGNSKGTKWGASGSLGGPGGGTLNRLNCLVHACKLLGLDFDNFRSGQPRGVYFAERGYGVLPFLRGETDDFEERADSWDDISEWWLDRWYSMRWPKKRDEIAEFDPSIYEVDRQIELCGPGVQGDTSGDQSEGPGSSPGVRS